MKKGLPSTILLVVLLIVGLSLLLYPSVSDYWNSLHQSKAIAEYAERVATLDDDLCDELMAEAREYNNELCNANNSYEMTESTRKKYNSLLNLSGNGIMGYIEIPSIDCTLPIYHGVNEDVLQKAIGHIEWTSLPIGGTGTHSAVSGHRGLPSAKLFTHLDKLKEGDRFMIRVLNEVITYEVDQILIVLPDSVDSILIEKDKDYCTLITCTPYGINTHRMLVRGHRVENDNTDAMRVTADALQIDPIIVAPIIASPMLFALLIFLIFGGKNKRGRKKSQKGGKCK